MLDDRTKNYKKIIKIFYFYKEPLIIGIGEINKGIGG
jgi:hypothetical protein